MKDNFQQINSAIWIIWSNIAEIDKLAGPIPDSLFQGIRSTLRDLEDEIEFLSEELQNK